MKNLSKYCLLWFFTVNICTVIFLSQSAGADSNGPTHPLGPREAVPMSSPLDNGPEPPLGHPADAPGHGNGESENSTDVQSHPSAEPEQRSNGNTLRNLQRDREGKEND